VGTIEQEDVIEPALPICDPHHHLYDWPGIPAPFPELYMLPEFLAEIANGGHNIESTVFVECTAFYRASGPDELRTIGETEFVTGVAAMAASGRYGPTRICEAMVGRVELNRGSAIGKVLEAHIAVSAGRLRGVRDSGPWDDHPDVPRGHTSPPKGLYASKSYCEGFAELQRHGLSFDAWQYHTQLPEVIALADAFPDTRIVLNHVGGILGIGPYAGRAAEMFPEWAHSIRALAERQNVWVKLGGLGQPITPFDFYRRPQKPGSAELAQAWWPYIETCIEAFGANRAMFESNFPVDGASCTYRSLWNAFKRITSGASPSEKALLFRDSARAFYRLI
jgi:predicted TIM-barrel fold metal-dependent hydrolase